MVLGVDRQLIALALARASDAVSNSFLIVVLPAYIASDVVSVKNLTGYRIPIVHISFTEVLLIGLLVAIYGIAKSVIQPLAGSISDRAGKRKVFIMGGLMAISVTSFAYVFVAEYVLLLLLRTLQGVSAGFNSLCTIALVNEHATDETRGNTMGVFNAFRMIGYGIGPIVAGTAVAMGPYTLHLGTTFRVSRFEAAFYIATFGALVSLTLVYLFVSDTDGTTSDQSNESLVIFDKTRDSTFDSIFALGVGTLFVSITFALFAPLQTLINSRLNQNELWFGLELGAVVVTIVLLLVPVGRLCDRFGRKPLLLGGFSLLVPAVFAQGIAQTAISMLLVRLVHGVAIAMIFAPALALAGDLAPDGQSGSKLSVLGMAFSLGTALGPLFSSYLVRYGILAPFSFGGVLAFLGLLLIKTQVQERSPVSKAG